MKKIAIFLIVLMMVSIGFLSGCNQQKTNNENIGTPTINYFSVTPSSISEGGTAELQWNVTNAESVVIYTEGEKSYSDVTNLENYTVYPILTTTYTLTAKNGDKETKATVQVIVEEATDAKKFIGTWFLSGTAEVNGDGRINLTYIFHSDRTLEFHTLYGDSDYNESGFWQIINDKLVYRTYSFGANSYTVDYKFSNNNNILSVFGYNFTKQ